MAKKKQAKAKEPINIRFKKLANGNQSIYLDCYVDGKRSYEFLKLYLVPETDSRAKVMNRNTMQAATAIKSQRIMDIVNGKAGLENKSRYKVLLTDYLKAYREEKRVNGQSEEHAKSIDNLTKHLRKYGIDGVSLQDIDKDFCLGFIHYLNNNIIIQIDPPSVASEIVFFPVNCPGTGRHGSGLFVQVVPNTAALQPAGHHGSAASGAAASTLIGVPTDMTVSSINAIILCLFLPSSLFPYYTDSRQLFPPSSCTVLINQTEESAPGLNKNRKYLYLIITG